MNVAIIEDEVPAAEKLILLLERLQRDIKVLVTLDNVKSAVDWLDKNQQKCDLIFMDIQLLDGKSFEIFQEIKVLKPIIFTTAFQEYSFDAFKVSSIDYLLKPITLQALETSISKFENLKDQLNSSDNKINDESNFRKDENFKSRFMVKFGDHIRSIPIDDISYLYAEGRNVYLYTKDASKYIIDFKLEELEGLLDPVIFFRVNRSFIIQLNSIKDVLVYSNSRLKIQTDPAPVKEIIVSREKVNAFKAWFDGT